MSDERHTNLLSQSESDLLLVSRMILGRAYERLSASTGPHWMGKEKVTHDLFKVMQNLAELQQEIDPTWDCDLSHT